MKDILANAPRMMKENGDDIIFKSFKSQTSPKGLPVIKAVVVHRNPVMPRAEDCPHEVTVIGIDSQTLPIYKQKRVFLSCNCLPGDMRVLTDKGFQTIYDIAETPEPDSYPLTYMVNGRAFKGTAPYWTGRKAVYRLTLSNGASVEGTADHRFKVVTDIGSVVWMPVSEINVNSKMLLNNPDLPDLPDKGDAFYHMQYLGFMQGDGSVTGSSMRPDLQVDKNSDKMEMVQRFTDRELVSDVNDVTTNRTSNSMCRVSFHVRAYELIRRYGYDNVNAVSWPTDEHFYGYLSGLISADASVSSNKGKVLTLQLRGSESYLRPVFDKLISLGYSSTVLRLERKAGTKTNIGTSTKDLYCLVLSAQTFKHMRDYLELTSRFMNYTFKPKVYDKLPTATVKDKIYCGVKDVYDITVPKVHKFVTEGGTIAHNCENFCYWWEYALAVHGATHIIYGNGEPPIMTNPHLVPGCCKHAVGVMRRIIRERK